MELIFLDKTLDNSIEHEIISDNEHGFKVTITYKEDSWMSNSAGEKLVRTMNNCTEVHYLYKTYDGKRIAFESDIHWTGSTRSVDDIESVVIQLALKKEEDFHN